MNVRQAAEYLGIGTRTLLTYAGEGTIPGFKLGNRWRFKRVHLQRWTEEMTIQCRKKPAENA